MAGIFFLAAEIALIGAALGSRVQALEKRAEQGTGAPPAPPVAGPPTAGGTNGGPANGAPARGPFAWLEETSGGFGVFIPILLGAGVILSMIAWLVERLARFATAPATNPGQVQPFSSLDLPEGGLVPLPAAGATAPSDGLGDLGATRPPLARVAAHWLVTVGAVGMLMVGVWFLREAAESRPGGGGPGTTTVELEISTRETGATMDQLVDALWVACRLRLPVDARLVSAEVATSGRAVLEVAPSLGETDERQFTGCLGDAVLDRVDADITRVETRAAPPAPVS
jgi:hypothetical protein